MALFTDLFKNIGDSIDDVLRAQEAGEGTIKENMDDLCDILEEEILRSKASEDEKKELLKRLRKFCNTETNIMLVGATGCGKSSTINALFAVGEEEEETTEVVNDGDDDVVVAEVKTKKPKYVEVAKVGSKADPETKDIEKYKIGNLVLWDTPGLGDGTEIDEHHKEVITELLREEDDDGNALIDLVLVILDGSTRDLGTSYKILNDVIIPELKDDTNRILIALNQADIAMKTGRHWDYEKNEPDETLIAFLNEKVESIKTRIKEDSNLEVEPVYYCAGYEEESGDVVHPYNLSKLLYYIMNSLPAEKRVAIMEGINTDSDNYEHNDEDEDYNEGIKDSFYDSFDYIGDGADKGAEIGGTILGIPGAIVGAVVGGFIGCVHSILDDIF
ncbi:GTPase family protein [Roseburia sp. 499]|uniref:GTPase family protein n=1 Tax=Roseburia sp. 499 TaxID=1261634 RepID=UPI000ADE6BDC|nr:GTPase [Roseburia sp. 499]WVK69946.1 GTPase [Roseburia sp. 499]